MSDIYNTPEWKALVAVRYHFQNATMYGGQAQAVFDTRQTDSHFYRAMLEEFECAARALGYDLVKREREAA